jgi:hypothetical protein
MVLVFSMFECHSAGYHSGWMSFKDAISDTSAVTINDAHNRDADRSLLFIKPFCKEMWPNVQQNLSAKC